VADPFVEIMDPLRVLRGRIEAVFADHGLKAVHVGIVPGTSTEGPHEVQVLATLADVPPAADDAEFDRLMREARDVELDERAEQARLDLERNMKTEGGFLD
jgi:hypothetical protein